MRPYERWELIQRAPDIVDSRLISATAATPNTFAIPTGARYAVITATGAVWIAYVAADQVELVTGGDFAATGTWTAGGTWSIAGGVATRTANAAGLDLSQPCTALVSGRPYRVTVTTTRSAGLINIILGGGTPGTSINSATTTIQTVVAGSDGTIVVRADASFAGTVDNFSVTYAANLPSADIAERGPELIYPNVSPVIRIVDGFSKLSIITNSGAQSASVAYYS